jgi:cysteine-rich repeat protein
MRNRARWGWISGGAVVAVLALVGLSLGVPRDEQGGCNGPAAYTTFDQTKQGCLNSDNGVNCNIYEFKDAVYTNGGPESVGLPDGQYFFAVLVPGSQNGGFLDGEKGNLSDTAAGGTEGDTGMGDAVANRTFTVTNGTPVYNGTHTLGVSPNGKPIVALMPYDNTSNNGGEYILALCKVGATNPSDCKYDAFKIKEGCGDGMVQPGEMCDDGNRQDGDACPKDCKPPQPSDAGQPPPRDMAGPPPVDMAQPPAVDMSRPPTVDMSHPPTVDMCGNPLCGDGTCNGLEDCHSCPKDCNACPPVCGDKQCDRNETPTSCPQDCVAGCGDGVCTSATECCKNCAKDCGSCAPECGDGTCNGGESHDTCPADCTQPCTSS